MKESYREILARYSVPESYADQGNLLGVATAGVQLGRVIEFRNPHKSVRRHPGTIGRQHLKSREARAFKAQRNRRPLAWLEIPNTRTGRACLPVALVASARC